MLLAELKTRPAAAALAVACVLYLSLALPLLRLPGLQYDETLFVNAATGRGGSSFVEWDVSVAGARIPVMLMRYVGALKAWLYAPVFAILGTGPVTVRLPAVLLGLMTLVFTWQISRRLFGSRAAAFAALLLGTDPSFIFCNRLDWGPVALSFVLKTAGLALVLRWLETGGAFLLMGGGFLFGLGLFDKLTFAWFAAAAAVAVPVCFWPKIRARLDGRSLAAGLAGLLLGASPLLSYNLLFPGRSFEGQKTVAVPTRAVIAARTSVLQGTLDGTEAHGLFNGLYRGEIGTDEPNSFVRRLLPGRTLTWHGWAAACAVSAAGLWFGRGRYRREKLFILLMSLVIVMMITVTVQATGPHHALVVYPLPQLLIASVLADFSDSDGKRQSSLARWLAGVILILGFVIPQTGMALRYLRSFELTGGRGLWSDAIYRLADFALRNPDRQLNLMEWGFQNQLQVLGGGHIRMQELFPLLESVPDGPDREAALRSWLLRGRSLYVFHHPRLGYREWLGLFERVVRDEGIVARIAQAFFQRDGEPVYVVYEVVPPEIEAIARAGRFYRSWEAEEAKRTGGGIEEDPEASGGTFLGNSWGGNEEDDVVFEINSERVIRDVHLRLRFDREAPAPRQYSVEVDRKSVSRFALPPTRPPGDYRRKWSFLQLSIGDVPAGRHDLRLRPVERDSPVLIDTVAVTEGPAPLPTEVSTRKAGTGYVENIEVLGFTDAPQVRLEVFPAEIVAGKDDLTLRVHGLDARKIDVVYEINGLQQPLLCDWVLDDNRSARVAVGAGTPRGLYRYVAIRDSRRRSPMSWVHVNAVVLVK